MLPANLRQEYGQENVLSTLTQVPIKSPFLPAWCVCVRERELNGALSVRVFIKVQSVLGCSCD